MTRFRTVSPDSLFLPNIRHLLTRNDQSLGKRFVKFVQHRPPFQIALCDTIQFVFHTGGELVIHDVRKILDKQIIDDLPGIRRE